MTYTCRKNLSHRFLEPHSSVGRRKVAALLMLGVAFSALSLAQTEQRAPYLLGVGDILTVSVWKSDELSSTVPVRPDGMISLPLIGDFLVAGKAPSEIRAQITAAFEEYVAAPAVSVVVKEIHSRRVFVVGEVAGPGAYDLLGPTKIMQLLALAGGLTNYAKKDQILILRDRAGQDQRIDVSIKDVTSGRSPEDNILLEPGDTIIVP